MRATIYVTDDDRNVCSALSRRLAKKGHLVRSFHSGESLLEALDYESPDLLFLDLKMPEMDGIETLRRVRDVIPKTLIVMLTAYGSLDDAEEALRLGAYDFLIKSVDFSTIEPALQRSLTFLELRRQVESVVAEKQRQFSWEQVIALSPLMKRVTEALHHRSDENGPCVFLQGEVGTGKEFLAQVLHYNRLKTFGPFVRMSCTETNGPEFDRELYGYERGAFSGAAVAMPGALESSEGGTLFIDAIEHLPLLVQASLAELIQTRTFRRLGGKDVFTFNGCLVIASAVLPGQVEKLHPELYSLLIKSQVDVPPLRARKEDIIPLTRRNIGRYCEEIGRPAFTLDSSVPPFLEQYKFPGNIRELEAMVRRAVLCADGAVLTSKDFTSQNSEELGGDLSPATVRLQFTLGQHSLPEIHRMVIHEVMRLVDQDKAHAADHLHISIGTLDEQIRLLENVT